MKIILITLILAVEINIIRKLHSTLIENIKFYNLIKRSNGRTLNKNAPVPEVKYKQDRNENFIKFKK